MTTLALGGDTMLGRGVGELLRRAGPGAVFASELVDVVATADVCVVNLECCISERGEPFPDRVFHFRAPPAAADALALLGVDAVTLANNHALDHGPDALVDTLRWLTSVGITPVGAGRDVARARQAVRLAAGGTGLAVVAVSDDPPAYAADAGRPGTAYADLRHGTPSWLRELVAGQQPPVLVTPHWGPNMVEEPVPHVRAAAADLVEAGATVVAGHSAHVFHGVAGPVLFDLGDLVDDYVVDLALRNDLSLLWLVTLDGTAVTRVEAVPLRIRRCRTDLADPRSAAFVAERLRRLCAPWGTTVERADGRLLVQPADWATGP